MKMLLVLILFLFAPFSGCATLDDLALGDSWFTAEPMAAYASRHTEPMIMSPRDALQMFYGCGLEHMILGRFYVGKNPALPLPEGLAAE